MSLPNLALPPDQDSYALVLGTTTLSIQLDGGASRYRADQLGASHSLTVQWTLSYKNYTYLMAFYRKSITFGADPFTIALIADSGDLSTYTVHIVPGSFGLSGQKGLSYIVVATLEINPDPTLYANDATIIAAGPE